MLLSLKAQIDAIYATTKPLHASNALPVNEYIVCSAADGSIAITLWIHTAIVTGNVMPACKYVHVEVVKLLERELMQ